jgi:fumarate hydratase class II
MPAQPLWLLLQQQAPPQQLLPLTINPTADTAVCVAATQILGFEAFTASSGTGKFETH